MAKGGGFYKTNGKNQGFPQIEELDGRNFFHCIVFPFSFIDAHLGWLLVLGGCIGRGSGSKLGNDLALAFL